MESPIEVQEYWFLTSSRSTSSRVEFLVEATMKELLIICVTVMAFAVPAHAQLFMAWNACDGTTGSSTANMDFDCNPASGATGELWGTFGLPGSTDGISNIEGIIDFAFQGETSVPEFWRFGPGGCNNQGIAYSLARGTSAVPCDTTNSTLFCGPTGSGCGGGIYAYVTGSDVPILGGPNRARLLFTNARSSPETTLPGMPTRVFCFHISILTEGASGVSCTGCSTPTAIAWNQAVLHSYLGQNVFIDSATPGSTGTLPTNGATISVATNKKSWGQLKSLYR